jgi:hypothetical protein
MKFEKASISMVKFPLFGLIVNLICLLSPAGMVARSIERFSHDTFPPMYCVMQVVFLDELMILR